MPERDPVIDARLRDVRVPSSLPARLAASVVFDDTAIDRIINDVALPPALMERLRSGPRAAANHGGGAIDLDHVRTVPASDHGRKHPWHRAARRTATIGRDALAVGCALVCGWLFFAAGQSLSTRLAGSPRSLEPRPLRAATAAIDGAVARQEPRRAESTPGPSVAPTPNDALASAVISAAPPKEDSAAEVAAATPAPAAVEVRGAAVGVPGMSSAAPRSAAMIPVAAGRSRFVPRVAGFDLAFEMTHGESPFIDPAKAGLATDVPPLVLATDSFDRLRFAARRSAWRNLKTEHVLAAIDAPDAARPLADDVRLDIRGLRSLRGGRDAPTILVEVAATAGPATAAAVPRSAVVVLDRCGGNSGLVWTGLCRGLGAVGRAMAEHDRLTVVVAGPVPRIAVRSGDAAAIRQVAVELESLPPTDVADLDAAMSLAEAEAEGRLLVACHADTADRARHAAAAAVAAWRGDRAAGDDAPGLAEGTDFMLIDPLPAGPTSLGRIPSDASSIRHAMLRQLFGEAAGVARNLRLEVAFDPRLVAAYRLVGHRQTAVDSLAHTPPATIDLDAGETARVVYEVVTRGRAVDGMVTANATWQTVQDGTPRRTRASFDATDADLTAALPSPHGCAVLLATALGEAASGSPHADPRTVSSALAVSRRGRARGDLPAVAAAAADWLERYATDTRRSP